MSDKRICSVCNDPLDDDDGRLVTLRGDELLLCWDCFDGLKQAIIYQDDE